MKCRSRVVAVTLSIVALVLLGPGGASAGGPGGTPPACQVDRPNPGALVFKGTMAVDVLNAVAQRDGGTSQIDYMLRLSRSGVTQFFNTAIDTAALAPPLSIIGFAVEDFICLALQDAAFAQRIRNAFGLAADRVFVITDRSISGAAAINADLLLPSGRAIDLADVTIWAQ